VHRDADRRQVARKRTLFSISSKELVVRLYAKVLRATGPCESVNAAATVCLGSNADIVNSIENQAMLRRGKRGLGTYPVRAYDQ